MRRMSLALIAVGAFLIVLAPMVRFYAYPRLAVAPANQISTTGLEAKGATIFDAATLKEITTDLAITVKTVGDASAPKKFPGSVAYVNTTVTKDSAGTMTAADGSVRGEVERMTFDATSGEATKGATGDFVSDTPGVQDKVVHSGLVAKFPFETQKKSYNFWDSTLLTAVPIKYVGTTKIEGMTVYKFNQVIAPTQYDSVMLPENLLGGTSNKNVEGQMMYSVDRTLLVEPHTGVIITRTEAQDNTIDYQGVPQITTTKATVNYDAKTVRKNLDDYGSQGKMLNIFRNVAPQTLFVLGLLMVIGGIVIGRRRPRANGTRVREMAEAHA
ncbi:MAG: hypothetical protein JWQ74_786 [Marmoricola sp.]|nr:hypothetical protein [Marmoricola sp.]